MAGTPLVYLIAGEPSGDLLASRLMKALREKTGGNVRFADGRIEAAYNADGSPCTAGADALRVNVSWEPSAEDAALVQSRIDVYAADEGTPVYTLETARYRKEAAA